MDQIEFMKKMGIYEQFLEENKIEIKPNSDLINYYLENADLAKLTRIGYKIDLKFFVSEINNMSLQEVKTGDMSIFINKLKKTETCGISRKRRLLSCIKSFYEFYRTLDSNLYPFPNIPQIPKQVKFKERAIIIRSNKDITLNLTEIVTLLERMKLLNYRDYLITRLMVGSGMRIGDVLATETNNVDLDNRCLKTMTKTGQRTYYFNENTKNELSAYIKQRNEVHVFEIDKNGEKQEIPNLFLNNDSKRINPRSYPSSYCRLIKQVGYTKTIEVKKGMKKIHQTASCHSMRRTFATIRDDLGQPEGEISFLLGHTIRNVTDLYIKKSHDKKLTIFDSFDFLSSY